MTIKDILVHVDDQKSCKKRIAAAIDLATEHDAHLTGIYVIPNIDIPGYMDAQMPADLIKMQEDRLADAANAAELAFNEAVNVSGLSAEWRCLKGYAPDIIADHGHYSDLIVIGQHDPNTYAGSGRDQVPDQVVLSSGRPVLIIPYNFAADSIGKNVIVGWDRGQRATRALHDALPVLQKADAVTVLMVNPKSRPGMDNHTPGADVAHHLARHNVAVEADHIASDEISICDHLLSRAADVGADLIVTGGYGHARWRELVLGGVTRQLLDTMPIPILMSH